MLANKPAYYDPVAENIAVFFYRYYFAPILEVVDKPRALKNAGENPLLAAIASGRVQYTDGVYSGTFNAQISREISKYAKFDQRSKTWKGIATPETKFAAIKADGRRRDINDKMMKAIDEAEANVNEALKRISLGDALPFELMGEDIAGDLPGLGVTPNLDERTLRKLRADYNDSQKLNIKNWAPEQTSRLRAMVEKYQTQGTNESLLDMIQSEWNTSAAKAKFLARQETGLFFEALSRNRAAGAGVRRYRWSTSHDERVRKAQPGRGRYAPNHKHLDGEIFDLEGEGGIVDLKTGRRAHAGADYNCRCAKIWILE